MTLSPTNRSGGTMNYRKPDSTTGADGSIPVNMSIQASRTKHTTRSGLRATLALLALSVALFLLPGQAFAGTTCSNANTNVTENQYCTPAQSLQAGLGSGQGGGGQPAQRVAVPQAAPGPTLPFTGLDVAVLAAVAIALTGTGVVLRRLATIGDSEQ